MSLTVSYPAFQATLNGQLFTVPATTITYQDNMSTFDELTPTGQTVSTIYYNNTSPTPYPPVVRPYGRTPLRLVQTSGGSVIATITQYPSEILPYQPPAQVFDFAYLTSLLAVTTGPYTGGFLEQDGGGISWYFSNLMLYYAAGHFYFSQNGSINDQIEPYLNLYISLLNSNATIDDIAPGLASTAANDSDDSYAATFALLAVRYLQISRNYSWLSATVATGSFAGQTNLAVLKTIVTNNIVNQIKTSAWCSTYQPSAVASGLTSPFQYGVRTFDGFVYYVGLLEDSCECAKALMVFGQFLATQNDASAGNYITVGQTLSINIHAMYAVNVNAWLWNDEITGNGNGQGSTCDVFTFNAGTNFATATGSGVSYVNGQQVIFGPASGATMPSNLTANGYTRYWIINSTGRSFQLSLSLAGPVLLLGTAGSGTINGFQTYCAWYPNFTAPIFPDLESVNSFTYQSGTLSISGNAVTAVSPPLLASQQGQAMLITGAGNYFVVSVGSGGTTGTVLGPSYTGTGIAYQVGYQTPATQISDGIRFLYAWQDIQENVPNWFESPFTNVFPDMALAWYALARRGDSGKAIAMYNRMCKYYLGADASPGFVPGFEVGQAQAVVDILTALSPGQIAVLPGTQLNVSSVTTDIFITPPSAVFAVSTGAETIPTSAALVVVQSATNGLVMTANPPLSPPTQQGQSLSIANWTANSFTLTAGSYLNLAGTSLTLTQNSIGRFIANSSLVWTQAQDALSQNAPVTPPGPVQTLTATTTIQPNAPIVRISAASPITLTSTPNMAAGVDGQAYLIVNWGSNAITLQTFGVLPGSGMDLLMQGNIVMPGGVYASFPAVYSAALGLYLQTGPLVCNPQPYVAAATALLGGGSFAVGFPVTVNSAAAFTSNLQFHQLTQDSPPGTAYTLYMTSGGVVAIDTGSGPYSIEVAAINANFAIAFSDISSLSTSLSSLAAVAGAAGTFSVSGSAFGSLSVTIPLA